MKLRFLAILIVSTISSSLLYSSGQAAQSEQAGQEHPEMVQLRLADAQHKLLIEKFTQWKEEKIKQYEQNKINGTETRSEEEFYATINSQELILQTSYANFLRKKREKAQEDAFKIMFEMACSTLYGQILQAEITSIQNELAQARSELAQHATQSTGTSATTDNPSTSSSQQPSQSHSQPQPHNHSFGGFPRGFLNKNK